MLSAGLPPLAEGTAYRFGLGDVMPSMLGSLRGGGGSLDLAPVSKAVVILVDGMGAQALTARAGHARTLAARVSKATTIDAGFPTTTASALATLTTGTRPGEHGIVGYSALDAVNDRVVNQLRGWDDRIDPATWQRAPTVFERATDVGVPAFAVSNERFRDSGFSAAVLRGSAFLGGASVEERLSETRAILDREQQALVYVYLPELDSAGHAEGWQSPAWLRVLEDIDSAVARFASSLRADEGLLVTADHGMLDVPRHAQVLFGTDDRLTDGLRFVAGEPRCLQLHLDPEADDAHRAEFLRRWTEAEQSRAWVGTRDEAIAAGWFGPDVVEEVLPRIGDVIVAARKSVAYYDERVGAGTGRGMVGQHGSITPTERAVPLLRFGAWAS